MLFISLISFLSLANSETPRYVTFEVDFAVRKDLLTLPLGVCVNYVANFGGIAFGIFECNAEKTKVILTKYGADLTCSGDPVDVDNPVEVTDTSLFNCDGPSSYMVQDACRIPFPEQATEYTADDTTYGGDCCQKPDYGITATDGCLPAPIAVDICAPTDDGNYAKSYCTADGAYAAAYSDATCETLIGEANMTGSVSECSFLTNVDLLEFNVWGRMSSCVIDGQSQFDEELFCAQYTDSPTMEPTLQPSMSPTAMTMAPTTMAPSKSPTAKPVDGDGDGDGDDSAAYFVTMKPFGVVLCMMCWLFV